MTNKKHSNGVITVLVSLMLLGILSLTTLVLEAGRLQTAKTQLAEANMSASTSMIAAYDADLYARYGLLAIDSERFTPERATEYLSFNSDLSAGYMGNRVTKMYDIKSVELTGLYNLTYPAIMKRQVLSRAKYHVIPQDYALNVYTMDAFFADFQYKCQYIAENLTPVVNGTATPGSISDVSVDMQAALSSLYATYANIEISDSSCDVTLSSSAVGLLPSVTGTVPNDVPSEDLSDINNALADASTVLGGSGSALSYNNGTPVNEIDVNVDVSFIPDIKNDLKDVSSASNVAQDTKHLAEKTKAMAQGFYSAINMLNSDKESNVLLNSYISEYFSNRNNRINTYAAPEKGTPINGTMDNATFASACVEYVFGGDASEMNNQDCAYNYLMAIRLISNLYAVMTDSPSFDMNNVYSVAAHMAWANYESYVDMELLTRYNVSVPFNKNQLILPITNPGSVSGAFVTKDTENALRTLGYYDGSTFVIPGSNSFSYKDSLAFALWFVPNSEKMLRVADLIQLEMRYREQYVENQTAVFLMSNQNTYCRMKCTGQFNSILPVLTLGSGGSVRGVEFQSIKYAGY